MTRLTKNIIYNVTGQGLVLVLSLIAVRFIFHRLGDDVFGLIFFNIVLTTVLSSALELGVSSTIVREVSSQMETDPGYVRTLIRTASTLYWAAGLVLVALIWITAPFLVSHWVNLRSIDPQTASNLLRIMSATSLVALPRGLYASVIRGRQLMHLSNAIDVGAALSQQAGILLILLLGGRVYAVAAWISINALLTIGAYLVTAAQLLGWTSMRPSFSVPVIRRNLGFTGHMMVISVLSLVHTQAAQVIVSKVLPIAEFGFYSFAWSTVNRATLITAAAAQAAFPSFSGLFAAGDRPRLLQQYHKLQDLVCYGTLPLFTGICFAALPVYRYVFNAGVAQSLLLPTAFLALGSWMNGTQSVPYTLSVAMGKPHIASRTTTYALFVVLPVTVVLIFVYGLPGAGFSWVFYNLFAYSYMVQRICRECLQVGPWEWYRHVAKVLGLTAITYGVAWLVVSALGMFTLPVLVAAYLLATAAFALAANAMIGADLKETLRLTLQRLRGSPQSPGELAEP
ncbi:MAG: lipopolysaccharide biosynthesis protein [Candidatus Dormibacterales bacterium]